MWNETTRVYPFMNNGRQWRIAYVKKIDGGPCEDYINRAMMEEIFDGVVKDKQEELAFDSKRMWK